MSVGTCPLSAAWRLAARGLHTAEVACRAGLLDPALAAAGLASYAAWGPSAASVYAAAAWRHGRRPAVVDDRRSLSFADLDRRTDAIAAGLVDLIEPGATVGLLARNHVGFVEAHLAASKAGATLVLLNTGFAAPQLAGVLEREGVAFLLHDLEFGPAVDVAAPDRPALVVDGDPSDPASLAAMAAANSGRRPPRPRELPPPVLLTSGTSGEPRGARRRRAPRDPRAALGLLAAIPYRVGDTLVVPAPLFHAWGFGHHLLAGALGMTLVLPRHSEPEQTVALVDRYRADALVVVPVMLRRILALSPQVLGRYRHPALRVVASSGSALSGRLAGEWMARFGDTLYNLYGSTEVGPASVAGPRDLRAAPGTAGRPLAGSQVAILGDDDRPVPNGRVGRIYVRSAHRFDAYTGGATKRRVGSMLSTGDLGHLDEQGRLYVDGRDDDMIVSGGENVFPGEVEDLLAARAGIADAAVVGVADEEYGQRLAAWIVRQPGSVVSADDLRRWVHDHLARHKVPRDVHFVDELPRSATGKLLRATLRSRPPLVVGDTAVEAGAAGNDEDPLPA